jgi:hypothetical protein
MLYSYNNHGYTMGLVQVEYLLLHNSKDPLWSDHIAEDLIDELERQQLRNCLEVRAHQSSMPSVLSGKWDFLSEEERHRLRFAPW